MTAGATVRTLYDGTPKFKKAMRADADRAVEKAARDIEGGSKRRIQELGLIDTGAMFNSVQASRVGELHWRVEVGVAYGVYHELGTRFLPARPFLFPTAELVRPSFYAAMAAIAA